MNADGGDIMRLLNAIADSNEQLSAVSENLRLRPGVIHVMRDLDIRKYETGTMIEMFIDVELKGGRAISWSLDIHCHETDWDIDASVRIIHEDGQDPIQEFPARTAKTAEDFIAQLKVVTASLASSADSINLSLF
jgi:hypothetical protein